MQIALLMPPHGSGFGSYISANILYDEQQLRRSASGSPAVIWLHPYAYNNGYSPGALCKIIAMSTTPPQACSPGVR